MSFKTEIIKLMSGFGMKEPVNPDSKHNTGRLIGEAFMWEEVAKYAESRAEAMWKKLEKEEIIPDKTTLAQGDHELAYSPSFIITAKVSAPIRRFSVDKLGELMAKSKYKVPVSVTAELCNDAKVPSNPMRTIKIIERG